MHVAFGQLLKTALYVFVVDKAILVCTAIFSVMVHTYSDLYIHTFILGTQFDKNDNNNNDIIYIYIYIYIYISIYIYIYIIC